MPVIVWWILGAGAAVGVALGLNKAGDGVKTAIEASGVAAAEAVKLEGYVIAGLTAYAGFVYIKHFR
jgi:hypothetical protein